LVLPAVAALTIELELVPSPGLNCRRALAMEPDVKWSAVDS
jgi:hypothetical protein